jgi:squalene-hopene/tetraprenyl-beta-curcumene cyclase
VNRAGATGEGLLERLRTRLLEERHAGHWVGELASSALSTAVAVVALQRAGGAEDRAAIAAGLDWLAQHQNPDGSWGDTVLSLGNISTTVLAWAACGYAGIDRVSAGAAAARAAGWITAHAGGLEPAHLVAALERRYGADRTFAVPILTLCAIAGRLGPDPWRWVRPLPFELAALPRAWFRFLDLQVVSYALPALIAVGQVRFHRRPPRNPIARAARWLARRRTLRRLRDIQPDSGGYLEAVPLTGFVVISLVEGGQGEHPVTAAGLGFLRRSRRGDGSWAIDSDLATWVTTLSLNALAAGGDLAHLLDDGERERLLRWLLGQQGRVVHPYTGAAAGAWAWTDLPGGVPDADDTAGALIALHHLAPERPEVRSAAAAGLAWLVGVQNRDGGIPTFCRGWGALEFDRSAPDLTAHALLAFHHWRPLVHGRLAASLDRARRLALRYLQRTQRPDGSWLPLWFGNQHVAGEHNPTYATARVVSALAAADPTGTARRRGEAWLLANQHAEGGWGGGGASPASIEETGLALEALARSADPALVPALRRGLAALSALTADGSRFGPAPIGFYFAKLWYFERLYPLIFAVAGAGRLARAAP